MLSVKARWSVIAPCLASLAAMGLMMHTGCAPATNNGGNNGGDDAALKIMTVAGTGTNGINGDGLHPLDTNYYFPQDMAVGPEDGLLYVVDWNNHRIRRSNHNTDDTYSVETMVGTGDLTGELQEEGPGKEAKLNHPTNIFFDNNGDLLIAAWHNSQITRYSFDTDLNTVIAGTGGRLYGGDGGTAKASKMNLPSSMVQDSQGNIYISDQANQRIRKIDTDGMITTYCGNGIAGYQGDNGPAANAEINSPSGQSSAPAGRLALDADDNLYFVDTANHVVRKISKADQMITTIAGTGFAGYSGDGGPASEAQLNTPSDLAVAQDGTIYIADTFNNRIRKIDTNGIISTFAGTGEAGFEGDDGHPRDAKLQRPYGVCLANNDQDLYVADTYNSRIRIISKNPPDLGTHTGTSEPPAAVPCSDEPGTICTFAGTGLPGFNSDGLEANRTNLYWPLEIEHTPSGRVYVNDWNNHKLRELQSDGTFTTAVGGQFIGDGPPDFSDLPPAPGALGTDTNLNHITDLLEMPDGRLLMTVWHNHKLRVFDPETRMVEVLAGRGPDTVTNVPIVDAKFDLPISSAIDADGNLWVVGQKNWMIYVAEDFVNLYDQAVIRPVLGNNTKTTGPMNLTGPLIETPLGFKGGPNPEPTGWIKFGPDGALYLAETEAHRIVRIEFTDDTYTDAVRTVVMGTGEAGFNGDGLTGPATQLDHPHDLEFGPDGNLYVADTNNYRVRRLNMTTGLVDTVVGTGEAGYSGDGGQATAANINRAFGLDFDLDGNLYVCDTFNSRIRRVTME